MLGVDAIQLAKNLAAGQMLVVGTETGARARLSCGINAMTPVTAYATHPGRDWREMIRTWW